MSALRALIFLSALVAVSITINVCQWPGYPLQLLDRRAFRRWMSFTERIFGSLIVALTYAFCPASIHVAAETRSAWDAMLNGEKCVLIANHQALLDWWYLWIVAWRENRHGDVKIILKESLKFLPIFGWGMWGYEFIFLKRKWANDKLVLESATQTVNDDTGIPCWLLIFPEGWSTSYNDLTRLSVRWLSSHLRYVSMQTGTVNDQPGVNASKSYANKISLPYPYKHVLLPKSTGLFFILRRLKVDSLYDLTVAYPPLGKGCAMDDFPIDKVFFEGKGPQKISMHLRRFSLDDIPGIAESWTPPGGAPSSTSGEFETDPAEQARHHAFTLWLRDRFLEKDLMLSSFFSSGSFPTSVPIVENLEKRGGKEEKHRHAITVHSTPRLDDWLTLIPTTIVTHYLLWKGIVWLELSLKSALVIAGFAVLGLVGVFIITGTISLGGGAPKDKKKN